MPIKKLKFFKILILVLMISLFLSPQINKASAQDTEVNIYLFWGVGCPYCEDAKPVLENMAESNPRIVYHAFEVYYVEENRDLFFEFGEAYGMEPRGVPTIYIADRYWVGFNPNIEAEISQMIDSCLASSCPDPGREILGLVPDTPSEENNIIIVTPTPTEDQSTESSGFFSSLGLRQVLIILSIVLGIGLIIFAAIRIIKPKNNKYKYR